MSDYVIMPYSDYKNACDTIRSVSGKTDLIKSGDLSSEIIGVIKGEIVLQDKTITENGTYTAPEGVDGYNPVTVNVPAPEIKLQDKTITENGEYTADSGFDGLGKVTVAVEGSGGSGVSGVSLSLSAIASPTKNCYIRFMYNGVLYAAAGGSASWSGYIKYIYKWDGEAWTEIVADTSTSGILGAEAQLSRPYFIEFDGNLHIVAANKHIVFDGETVSLSTQLPESGAHIAFVYRNKLMAWREDSRDVYEWNDAESAWELFGTFGSSYWYPFVANGELYCIDKNSNPNTVLKYTNGSFESIGFISKSSNKNVVINENLYQISNSANTKLEVLKYNPASNEEEKLGEIPYFYLSAIKIEQGTNKLAFTTGVYTGSSNPAHYTHLDVNIN